MHPPTALALSLLSLLPVLCPAQGTQKSAPDLAKHVAWLASDNATDRGTAVRNLTVVGEAAIKTLHAILRAGEKWPPRQPVWNRVSLYPTGSLWTEAKTLDRFAPHGGPNWTFLAHSPDVPRSRRGRIRVGNRAWNPRVLATFVLANLRASHSVRIRELIPLLADRDVEVRFTASFALGSMGSAVTPLVEALDDDAKAAGAAHALAVLGMRARTVVFDLVTSMPENVTAKHRNAVSLLAHLPQTELAIPVLVDRLGHKDADVRRRASVVLGLLGRHATPALREALTEDNPERQCRALALFARTSHWTEQDNTAITSLQKAESAIVRKCVGEALAIHESGSELLMLKRLRPMLKEMMRSAIAVRRPNASALRRQRMTSVFDGSYDFHSCVIAHWSLLVMARLDKDEPLEQLLLDKLDAKTLSHEAENLASLPKNWSFFPYDQGWFLMMLGELARREGPHRPVVSQLRRDIEDRILTFLEAIPLPDWAPRRLRGKKTFSGFYRSWLFGYLLLQMSKPIGEKTRNRLRKLRKTKIEPNRTAITNHQTDLSFDFLWLPAILALIDRTSLDADGEKPAPYRTGTLKPLPHKVPFRRVHILGRELTRIWPLALDGGRGDEKAMRAYAERVHAFVEHREIFSGNFRAIAHWIPQFLWIGMWLSLGAP